MNSSKSNKNTRPLRKLRFLSPLHKANRQASVYLEAQLVELGVLAVEAHLLAYVNAYGPCAVGELVRVFGLKRPTMTSMLDRLSERGLVKRDLHPEDRRSFLVRVTARGAKLGESARKQVERLEAEIGRRVSNADVAGFERVMQAIDAATGVELRSETSARGQDRSTSRRKKP